VNAAPAAAVKERPDFVVVMLGLSDRAAFREEIGDDPQDRPNGTEAKPKPAAPRTANREFRSDRWRELYAKRIDEMIAALQRTGAPVLWAGLPPIRGPRSRSDIAFLNELYRARAEKAGITYVDLWEGFIAEDGKFSIRGPDYEGQIRQLRSADGVYFTKAGAVKLGHYVGREIQHQLAARTAPVVRAAPEPQQDGQAEDGAAKPRPLVGPVVPLTGVEHTAQELAGAGGARVPPSPLARRVLLQGEALAMVPGRADDFSWPRERADTPAVIAVPVAQSVKLPPRDPRDRK
jgi:hypothetical protein